MTERTEIWVPVAGHEGEYEVSNLGRVRSLDRQVWMAASSRCESHWHSCRGRVLRPGRMNKFGHLSVALGKGNSRCVHALVAAFHGPRPEAMDVCHRDGDATNNAADNLYYGTRSDNNRDMVFHGRRKLTVAEVHEIRRRSKSGETATALAREFGVCVSNMCYVVKGVYYAHV